MSQTGQLQEKTSPLRSAGVALGFLTTVPVPAAGEARPGDLGRAAVWFPVVGAGLGVALSAAAWALGQWFDPYLTAVLVVALWALLTGGLHLDGLADCGDGLLAAASPARRLEIMRDPRLGSFGGLTLVLFLMAKVFAVAAAWGRPLAGWGAGALLPAGPLVVAAVLARWLILLAARAPSARPGGLGAAFALGLTPPALLAAAVVPVLCVALGGWRALLAALAAHAAAWALLRLARARLGGVTGDVFGLVIEASELIVLLAYAAG